MSGFVPLVVGLRGNGQCQETLHTGSIAIVDGNGRAMAGLGDPEQRFPLRSTIKSIQLLPLLLDGLDDKFSLTDADLAVMMSSHSGEDMHVQRISGLLERFGLHASQLRCGSHPPRMESDRLQLLIKGENPSVLHCNCSGKHTGMLAVCAENGWPLETYLERDHPLQIRILKLIREFANIPADQKLDWAIDGCSLPSYALSLRELARIFSRLARPETERKIEQRAGAPLLTQIREAARGHPEMIAGSERLDTRLMARYGDRLYTKTGADGMYAMALSPTTTHPHGLGIAFKIADGDPNSRIRELTAVSLLRQLEPETFADIDDFVDPRRLNNVGTQVGSIQAVFSLNQA